MTSQSPPDTLAMAPGSPAAILNDADLLIRCRNNDAEAWKRLYIVSAGIIRGIAWSMGLSADAEDICQETILALFKEFRENRAMTNVMGYIRIVSRRRCIDRLRKANRTVEYLETVSDEDKNIAGKQELVKRLFKYCLGKARDKEDAAAMMDTAEILKEQLDHLGEPCHSLLLNRFNESLSYEQISQKMKISLPQIGVHLGRCLKRLRDMLKANPLIWNESSALFGLAGNYHEPGK